jgi:hypothetical protein
VLSGAASVASASPLYSGSIAGSFSNPVFAGSEYNPTTGVFTFSDNTATAVYAGMGTDSITWGTTAFPDPGVPIFSSMSFTGATFSNVQPDEEFLLGVLTYTNGGSNALTLIYGVTLTLQANLSLGIGPVTPYSPSFELLSNSNVTNGPCTGIPIRECPAASDFVRLPGLSPSSLNVLEGGTASALIYGGIFGDPFVEVTRIALAPGSEGAGFISDGFATVPEPTSMMLCATGLAVLGRRLLSRKYRRG